MKRFFVLLAAAVFACALLAGCSGSGSSTVENKTGLAEGTYEATFKTDSTMFSVNEAYNGKGTLTVDKNGATINVVLKAKGIDLLYLGTAEEAKANESKALKATEVKVTYSDGMTKKCYAFDVPVSELDTEFDLAIHGTDSGKWYDHKVVVKDAQLVTK